MFDGKIVRSNYHIVFLATRRSFSPSHFEEGSLNGENFVRKGGYAIRDKSR